MIHQNDVFRLFEELWPAMRASNAHKQHCLTILPRIESCFRKWGRNHDGLLDCLASLDGIGLTIASGLIWSAYPDEAVPFDKWTMTYALDKKRLSTPRISNGNYTQACQKVLIYCDEFVLEEDGKEHQYKIKDFVREALIETDSYEWSASPE